MVMVVVVVVVVGVERQENIYRLGLKGSVFE